MQWPRCSALRSSRRETRASMTEAPVWRRYFRLLRPDSRADVDDELAFHLEMRVRELATLPERDHERPSLLLVRELVERGMPPAAARAEAERIFGDMRAIRDACVTIDERRLRRHERREGVDDMMRDFSFAARAKRGRRPPVRRNASASGPPWL